MRRVTYTKEFREEACRLVSEQHLSIRQAANNLGISDGALGRWLRESKTPERAKKNQPNHCEEIKEFGILKLKLKDSGWREKS
jgi:transposase-like protein